MTQVLEVRKLSEVNEELQQLSKECEKAFSAWIRDRENTKLFVEYKELLKTEGVTLKFKKEAIVEMAKIATEVNSSHQNIGARRLHTVLEKILEDYSFDAPDMGGKTVTVNSEYVRNKLKDIVKDEDMSRYIL